MGPDSTESNLPSGFRFSKVSFYAALALVLFFGFFHVIQGKNLPTPQIEWKENFGFSETFINIEEVIGMPFLAAKIKFPLSIRILQKLRYIETDEQFHTRVKMETAEEIRKSSEEFKKKSGW